MERLKLKQAESVKSKIHRKKQKMSGYSRHDLELMRDNRNYWVIHASITPSEMFIKFSQISSLAELKNYRRDNHISNKSFIVVFTCKYTRGRENKNYSFRQMSNEAKCQQIFNKKIIDERNSIFEFCIGRDVWKTLAAFKSFLFFRNLNFIFWKENEIKIFKDS